MQLCSNCLPLYGKVDRHVNSIWASSKNFLFFCSLSHEFDQFDFHLLVRWVSEKDDDVLCVCVCWLNMKFRCLLPPSYSYSHYLHTHLLWLAEHCVCVCSKLNLLSFAHTEPSMVYYLNASLCTVCNCLWESNVFFSLCRLSSCLLLCLFISSHEIELSWGCTHWSHTHSSVAQRVF